MCIRDRIHAATLLHDDVVDQSDVRHNVNTANKLWGNDSAVLVGDFLYSRAFELIVEINRERVYKILAETTNKISQGEVMQLMYKEKIIKDREKYIEIVYLKTGKLFEASALVAMDIAGSSNHDWAKQFGKNFGIAYQLRNDYLEYFGDNNETGKNIAEDYRIVLLLGDQLTDFISTKEAYVYHSDRKKLANKYSDMWGSKWFMITNPTYGRWELSIYDEMPNSEEEAIQKRKETLNP